MITLFCPIWRSKEVQWALLGGWVVVGEPCWRLCQGVGLVLASCAGGRRSWWCSRPHRRWAEQAGGGASMADHIRQYPHKYDSSLQDIVTWHDLAWSSVIWHELVWSRVIRHEQFLYDQTRKINQQVIWTMLILCMLLHYRCCTYWKNYASCTYMVVHYGCCTYQTNSKCACLVGHHDTYDFTLENNWLKIHSMQQRLPSVSQVWQLDWVLHILGLGFRWAHL